MNQSYVVQIICTRDHADPKNKIKMASLTTKSCMNNYSSNPVKRDGTMEDCKTRVEEVYVFALPAC